MLVLHRAFDATAGRRVFADDLDAFISRHQHFLPLRNRIAAFFEMSRAVFFGVGVQAPDVASWMGLCRDLARAEQSG
jgi:mxaA protein